MIHLKGCDGGERMGIMDCPACGKPRLFSRVIGWGDNGTIVSKFRPAFRLVLVESALLEDIYQRIENMLGISIREIVFEAERAASIATIDSLMPDWIIRWLMRNRIAMHPTSWGMQELARIAGLGDVHTVFYHVYRGAMSRVRNVYNRELFAAMVVGAFERVEGVIYDHVWIEMGEELFLLINHTTGKPEMSARMQPRLITPLPGQRRMDRCRQCGFPRDLDHLRWDTPNAIITDERRGVRMSFVDSYAFSMVFQELIDEFGEEIVPVIVAAASEYTRSLVEETGILAGGKEREEVYREFLELLPLHGKGNPVQSDLTGDAIVVTIENPYSTYLLSGELLAIYEAVEAHPGTIDIYDEAQRVKITITP
jgi:hypothetical protein